MKSTLKTLKLLADPTRLRIINVLNEESLSVAELQEILGMGQSRISTQLAQLRQEGVVEDARSGKNVFYTLSLAGDLHNVALKACEELPEAETDKKALQVILDKRKNRTQAYFDEVVCRLGKNYAPGRSWKALAGALLRILNYDVVADLGAGEGFVSQLISPSAKQVIAVDNSPSMVELGQELARKHGLDNLEYRLGDIEAPPIKPGTVDLALLSQALHHAQKPSRALEAAWDILKSGGCLVVLDLLQHGQEEARELYADRWLGFTPAALESMLKEAGFRNIHTDIVDREPDPPHFQTLMAAAWKPWRTAVLIHFPSGIAGADFPACLHKIPHGTGMPSMKSRYIPETLSSGGLSAGKGRLPDCRASRIPRTISIICPADSSSLPSISSSTSAFISSSRCSGSRR